MKPTPTGLGQVRAEQPRQDRRGRGQGGGGGGPVRRGLLGEGREGAGGGGWVGVYGGKGVRWSFGMGVPSRIGLVVVLTDWLTYYYYVRISTPATTTGGVEEDRQHGREGREEAGGHRAAHQGHAGAGKCAHESIRALSVPRVRTLRCLDAFYMPRRHQPSSIHPSLHFTSHHNERRWRASRIRGRS